MKSFVVTVAIFTFVISALLLLGLHGMGNKKYLNQYENKHGKGLYQEKIDGKTSLTALFIWILSVSFSEFIVLFKYGWSFLLVKIIVALVLGAVLFAVIATIVRYSLSFLLPALRKNNG